MRVTPQQLSAHYAAMNESELLHLAERLNELTDYAQSLLRAEFARRALELPPVEEHAEPEVRELATVRRYRDLTEAMVGRSLLEAAGIPAWIQDENLVRMDWFYSNAVGGIRLQVEARDEAAAREVLDQPVPESIAFDGGDEFVQPRCPMCGSLETSFIGPFRGAAMLTREVMSAQLPPDREGWLCRACGTVWEDMDDGVDDAGTATE
jgi:hypothetical protein